MAVNPESLTYFTAIEGCTPPQGEECSVCLEALEGPAPQYDNNSGADGHKTVFIKVCGPKHFFHRRCIMRWWRSASPMLNTCPMDCVVAYGGSCNGLSPRSHD
ncbi:zf-rbx1 multi-domain protein [Pyrenophora tritici-repentis]|nr:zf-rbx1 multi-domain protein [Pyrenophora tritici-repentis]KAI1559476.1 zf-rbx1 multi-domain protein [Pyrenophora tritici-repentis]